MASFFLIQTDPGYADIPARYVSGYFHPIADAARGDVAVGRHLEADPLDVGVDLPLQAGQCRLGGADGLGQIGLRGPTACPEIRACGLASSRRGRPRTSR